MRTKLTDGSQTGNLHTATIPWRVFSMDITEPFMQASIHENWYQCAIIERIQSMYGMITWQQRMTYIKYYLPSVKRRSQD